MRSHRGDALAAATATDKLHPVMIIWRPMAFSAAALAASVSVSDAGTCSAQIDAMRARIDARLDATAGAAPTSVQSPDATMHRQPTPRSIAAAEQNVGALSEQAIKAVTDAMARARAADGADDANSCQQALQEVERELDRNSAADR